MAGDKCEDSHLQFSLDSNGVLRHSCSRKMVCPENGNNGAKILLSDSCTTDFSKFERTTGLCNLFCTHFIIRFIKLTLKSHDVSTSPSSFFKYE